MMVSISSTILGVPWALLPPPAPAPARISASANRAWAAVSTNTNIDIFRKISNANQSHSGQTIKVRFAAELSWRLSASGVRRSFLLWA